MHKHPFDAISFFFGLVFTVGAVAALVSGADPWPFDRAEVWPVLLIVGGLLMLAASLRRDRTAAGPAIADPAAGTVGDRVHDTAIDDAATDSSATDDTIIDDTTDPALIAARREIDQIASGTPDDAA